MADKIVGEYDVRVDKALKDLDKLSKRVDKIDKDGQKSAKNVEQSYSKMASNLSSQFKKVGLALGVAFGAQQVLSLGRDMVKLSAQAEGVERAFRRIGSPEILEGLRRATRGTVSDLQLMQNAVKASNFKIPLENLASLFAFAQARARETGESVDYLVDSIVTGIGRKSPLILDNLGISAVELRERLNGVGMETASVGDIAQIVGDIATEELEKMGDQADTTADKLAQINVVWENMKTSGGEMLINLGTGLLYLFGQIDTGIEKMDGVRKAAENLAEIYEDDVAGAVDNMIKKNQELLANQLKIAELEDRRSFQNSSEAIKNINDRIAKLKERNEVLTIYIQRLKQIYDQWVKTHGEDDVESDQIRNLKFLNEEIKKLQEERLKQNTTLERTAEINQEIYDLEQERIALLGGQTDAMKKLLEQAERLKEALKIDTDEEFEMPDLSNVQAGVDEEVKIRQDGSDRIQQINDQNLKNALEAIDEEEKAKQRAFENDMRREEERLQLINQTLSTASSISSSINQIIQNQFQSDLQALQKQFEQGELTREEFERKQTELQRKSAQASKDAALFNAIIGTSQAIINALASPSVPFPVAAGFAALAAAQGAVQIAAIASEPLPTFAEGGMVAEHGMLKGKSHTQGGIMIEAEGEEYFMPKDKTRKHYGLLEAIRQGAEEQYILRNYVPKMIDESMFNGFADMGKSAELNGITANLKDHNLIAAIDRGRQSTSYGLNIVARKLDKLTNVNTRKGW